MHKFFSIKKILQYYLPVCLTLFMLLTMERTVITDGGNDRLYGLPWGWITSSYAASFRYDVFILPLLLNLLVFFAFAVAVFFVIGKAGLSLKANSFFIGLGIAVSLFWILEFYLLVNESAFYLQSKLPYTTTSQRIVWVNWP